PRPLSGALPAQEREDDALERGHPREHIRDRRADSKGRAVRRAGQAHQAAFALDDRVVARPSAPGTVRAVPRDRGVYEAGDAAANRGPIEPEPVESARAEVLHEHVRRLEQAPQDLAPARVLEVQRDAALAAVHGEEVNGLAVHERRAPAPRVVALAGLFDLDDV